TRHVRPRIVCVMKLPELCCANMGRAAKRERTTAPTSADGDSREAIARRPPARGATFRKDMLAPIGAVPAALSARHPHPTCLTREVAARNARFSRLLAVEDDDGRLPRRDDARLARFEVDDDDLTLELEDDDVARQD